MMTPGDGALARGCALLLISLLLFPTGYDFSIATSRDFVHEKVCDKCGAPSQFDRGCPVRVMERYPHTDYNTIKENLNDDAERFEKMGESFDTIAQMWGPPFEAGTISNAHDVESYGHMLTADQKSRFHFWIKYDIHADPYVFLLDDRKRVIHFTGGDFAGEYSCSRCGGSFARRPAR